MTVPLLRVCSLKHNYGPVAALDDVSFEVAEGETFGLLGPNGAGKTTLLSIVSSLLEAQSGRVQFQGQTVDVRDKSYRRQIGIVPQELAIYDDLTARENLRFFGQLYGCAGPQLSERIRELLAASGLEDRADDRAGNFSGGMKRRLNLAASLMHSPRLLLLDEPTTGVDPQSRNRIFQEIRRVNQAGMTVIYTSHYMEEVQALCTRIGIMDHGRLIACDTLQGLLKRLHGSIRFRAPTIPVQLRDRLGAFDGTRLIERGPGDFELECGDVKSIMPGFLNALSESRAELHALEIEEPNLENVFLHLTGRALRD